MERGSCPKIRFASWNTFPKGSIERIDPFNFGKPVEIPVVAVGFGGMLEGVQGDQGVCGEVSA
jgi:hypothetical protein